MRLAAIDASVDDARTERALSVALGRAPDRLFLFGAARTAAARLAERDIQHRDERFLDVAAAFLLDAPPSPSLDAVPSRARLAVPLVEIAVCIGAPQPPLTSTLRAVEMVGAHLCMAVAEASVDVDEVDNAALWICGGGGAFRVDTVKTRTVVGPGDACGPGYIAILDVLPSEIRVSRVDLEGQLIEQSDATVAAHVRISVQG